ncbi:MAG TPA: proline--tRNA ligase [Kiritimatiellia bacterium]|nr:proline--tRNA ligase [Kiritimatiellia bacterium]HRZ11890.1 proline--tRNA ligase [Kiritimatiellia bacterium]HSA17304.1 proline--tRNA ligase [Kiritimatiellia bacterium]
MRWSRQLIPTLREVPQEAEIPSHQLMLRAGLIRKLGAGLYTFLPLGLRALRKVERIVREEMNRAGALEILMPALHPKEVWEQTGRYELLRDVMFKVKDRQQREMVLGPTHEEIVTDLVAHEVSSYRQLPVNLYQIQTKFRDEIRPRFGLMRAKEFIMKDGYSFDADLDGAEKSYRSMYEAYQRVFQRCGLRAKIVEADTGAMGGSSSHEFMVLADSGEDGLVECDACSYAANLERAESVLRSAPSFADAEKDPEKIATPGLRTVEEVAGFFQSPPARLIKTLIYVADGKPVAALVPGNRDVNEIKLRRALGAKALELADAATIARVTGAPVGFAGPVGLSIPLVVDAKLRGYRGAVTGANEADAHLRSVDIERDVKVTEFADISFAIEGDGCPRCAGTLRAKRGVEVGHVFKLGTKYSEQLGALYLGEDGQKRPCVMGCYGIGVTRTLQAVIEQSHDDNGIIWPATIAPAEVEVLLINEQHAASVETAGKLVEGLKNVGIEVLFDERAERPGVKFKDADLLGLPLRINVGERGLAKGSIELRARHSGETLVVPVESAVETACARLAELKRACAPGGE